MSAVRGRRVGGEFVRRGVIVEQRVSPAAGIRKSLAVLLDDEGLREDVRHIHDEWSFKKSTEAPFVVDVPDAPTQAFVIEKDSKRFPDTGGWGYAVFNHDVATGKMTADEAKADCGHICHVAVKSKDYIFHSYQTR